VHAALRHRSVRSEAKRLPSSPFQREGTKALSSLSEDHIQYCDDACREAPAPQRLEESECQEPDAEARVSADTLEVQPLCVESSPGSLHSTNGLRNNRHQSWWRRFGSEKAWTTLRAASAVAPFWFLAQLCFNTSLHLTSVTSNTILSSPSSLFTYMLSIVVLHERFTYSKLNGVMLTVIGTS
jgi:multidrug transporter EmrE-like cation transporter